MSDINDPCRVMDKCPMSLKEGVGNTFKKHYCWGGYANCARFQVLEARGPAFVPITLLPNMNEEAKRIIESREEAAS